MFTGLIEDMGTILSISLSPSLQTIIQISSTLILNDISLGDSISVNGICLTVISFTTTSFHVGLSPETIKRTTSGEWREGDRVNLERSVTANKRMGGHLVQGHVDGVGRVVRVEKDKDAVNITIGCEGNIIKYIVEKGYIAIDGTSLTVVGVKNLQEDTETKEGEGEGEFTIMLIQYTQEKVTLAKKKVGDKVNLEADITGKQIVSYMENFVKTQQFKRIVAKL